MTDRIEGLPGGGVAFHGRAAVDVYRATVIASGLSFYAKTGMRINRAYTPRNMMRAAAEITGQTFKPRDYARAAQALRDWARNRAALLNSEAQGNG